MSFVELEQIWTEEFEPELATFACMTEVGTEPPVGSRWRHNWKLS